MNEGNQIIVPDMPHMKEIYRIFRDGGFISEQCLSETKRRYYRDLENNYDAFFKYFDQLGLFLEKGNGYFHLCEEKTPQRVQNSIRTDYGTFFTILRLLTMWKPDLSAGHQFKSYDLQQFCDENDEAKHLLPESKDGQLSSRVSDFLSTMEKQGFVDLSSDESTCMVTSAFSYLKQYVTTIRLYGDYSKYNYSDDTSETVSEVPSDSPDENKLELDNTGN